MRSAGGTEMGMTMIVADYVRRNLNLQPYRASEAEARRFVEDLRIYERAVARFQYRNSDDALHDAMLRLPIEPNGVETDPVEVAVNRNIARIDTNRVRGGALRVINDGLLGRSQKTIVNDSQGPSTNPVRIDSGNVPIHCHLHWIRLNAIGFDRKSEHCIDFLSNPMALR